MHPTQIEHAIDLANQMVRRHNLVQIKGIKELALSILPPTHHATLPMMIDSVEWNHGSPCASMGLLQHNPPKAEMPRLTTCPVVLDDSRRADAYCQFGSSHCAGKKRSRRRPSRCRSQRGRRS